MRVSLNKGWLNACYNSVKLNQHLILGSLRNLHKEAI